MRHKISHIANQHHHDILKLLFYKMMVFLLELYAERNYISEVKGLTKPRLPSLKAADFSYNRYNCDCHLRDFLRFLGSAYNEEVKFRHLSATSRKFSVRSLLFAYLFRRILNLNALSLAFYCYFRNLNNTL